MDGEISSGMKIGIVIVLLCILIGIVFYAFNTSKESANKGTAEMEQTMTQLSESKYTDYDQRVVTGSEVVNIVKTFGQDPIAIYIATYPVKGNATEPNTFTNYGALLEGSSVNDKGISTAEKLTKNSGDAFYTKSLQFDEAKGDYKRNSITRPLTQKGTSYCVRNSAKFLGEIIKDESGNITGIAFTQQK